MIRSLWLIILCRTLIFSSLTTLDTTKKLQILTQHLSPVETAHRTGFSRILHSCPQSSWTLCRCVGCLLDVHFYLLFLTTEINVRPSKKGLTVTHGYTFSKGVSFSSVCQAIGDSVVPGCWPVFISLECHVDAVGQKEMVKQMLEIWGDKLVKGKLENVTEDDNSVTPGRLR